MCVGNLYQIKRISVDPVPVKVGIRSSSRQGVAREGCFEDSQEEYQVCPILQ